MYLIPTLEVKWRVSGLATTQSYEESTGASNKEFKGIYIVLVDDPTSEGVLLYACNLPSRGWMV